jgi:uncharacterized protein (DUF1778 family)
MLRIILDPEEYDFLIELLERKPIEEMPKLRKLDSTESPFASPEEKCTR